tara:strand:+ start:728 stop:868 length:141 start_codon:yes stop_codon:yes gene_type:complete
MWFNGGGGGGGIFFICFFIQRRKAWGSWIERLRRMQGFLGFIFFGR